MKLRDLKSGDKVMVDGGFNCMRKGPKIVHQDAGGKYVTCKDGRHYLAGQVRGDGELEGISYPPINSHERG